MYNDLKFISNSGIEVTGGYNAVSDTTTHRISEFDFVGVSGSYYQKSTIKGLSLPLKIFVYSNDLEPPLKAWRAALKDTGVGVLYHPDSTIGIVNVVVSSFTINTDFNKRNVATIDVTFLQSIKDLTETVSPFQAAETLENSLNQLTDLSIKKIPFYSNITSAIGNIKTLADNIETTLSSIVTPLNEGYQLYLDLLSSVKQVSTFTTQNLKNIFYSMKNILQIPELTLQSEHSKIEQFEKLIEDTYQQFDFDQYDKKFQKEQAHITIDNIKLIQIAFLQKFLFLDFEDRANLLHLIYHLRRMCRISIEHCHKIADEFPIFKVIKGETEVADPVVVAEDLENIYVQDENPINDMLVITVANLLIRHENLRPNEIIYLEKEKTMIEICATYYNSVSHEIVSKFIQKNKIQDHEFMLLKKGRKIII